MERELSPAGNTPYLVEVGAFQSHSEANTRETASAYGCLSIPRRLTKNVQPKSIRLLAIWPRIVDESGQFLPNNQARKLMPRKDGHLTNQEMSEALRRLAEEQQAMEHAIRTGEVKLDRTPQNSTPAKHLDD